MVLCKDSQLHVILVSSHAANELQRVQTSIQYSLKPQRENGFQTHKQNKTSNANQHIQKTPRKMMATDYILNFMCQGWETVKTWRYNMIRYVNFAGLLLEKNCPEYFFPHIHTKTFFFYMACMAQVKLDTLLNILYILNKTTYKLNIYRRL